MSPLQGLKRRAFDKRGRIVKDDPSGDRARTFLGGGRAGESSRRRHGPFHIDERQSVGRRSGCLTEKYAAALSAMIVGPPASDFSPAQIPLGAIAFVRGAFGIEQRKDRVREAGREA